MQKAFFKALCFAVRWPSAERSRTLSLPTQHLATPPREERAAVSHVLMDYFLPSR